MSRFDEILAASSEELLKLLYRSSSGRDDDNLQTRPRQVAKNLGLTYAQLVCALGFNKHIQGLSDVLAVLGFESYDDMAKERNRVFTTDIYQQLGIKDTLAIYQHVITSMELIEIMQHLIALRLQAIENRIEAIVNSVFIERYKKEMRSIYNDGVAEIDFAEQRLSNTHSGFRALLNEVALIVESRLIPIGDIFFRDTILPEEKRRLIIRGLIPRELVRGRLSEENISEQERSVLEDQLKLLDA